MMPAPTYISPRKQSLRVALRMLVLVLMAAVTLASSSRVSHSHEEGDHPHRLESPVKSNGERSSTPIVIHSHIHLFGLDLHIPLSDEEDAVPDDSLGEIPRGVAELSAAVDDHQSANDSPYVSLASLRGLRLRLALEAESGAGQRVHEWPVVTAPNLGRMLRLKLASLTV